MFSIESCSTRQDYKQQAARCPPSTASFTLKTRMQQCALRTPSLVLRQAGVVGSMPTVGNSFFFRGSTV